MNIVTAIFKYAAIIFNTLFLALLIALTLKTPPEGASSIAFSVVVYIYLFFNLSILILSARLLVSARGTILSSVSIFSSLVLLLILFIGVGHSDIHEAPKGIRLLILTWLLVPLLTAPATLLLRLAAKKTTNNTKLITCPHCGGEVTV